MRGGGDATGDQLQRGGAEGTELACPGRDLHQGRPAGTGVVGRGHLFQPARTPGHPPREHHAHQGLQGKGHF